MFADIFKELRARSGMSQGRLANEIGVSAGNISDWEAGKTKPGYAALIALARYFKVPADYLLETEPGNTGEHPAWQCDGIPLNETETDLIAMYRLVDDTAKEDIFDIAKLKYEKATGKRESIYSTYSDTKGQQKGGPGSDSETAHEIA